MNSLIIRGDLQKCYKGNYDILNSTSMPGDIGETRRGAAPRKVVATT